MNPGSTSGCDEDNHPQIHETGVCCCFLKIHKLIVESDVMFLLTPVITSGYKCREHIVLYFWRITDPTEVQMIYTDFTGHVLLN